MESGKVVVRLDISKEAALEMFDEWRDEFVEYEMDEWFDMMVERFNESDELTQTQKLEKILEELQDAYDNLSY